jgi:2'-5' RNA ligase
VRLFVAAFPPPEVVADLTGALAGLAMARAAERGAVRLTPHEQWHLTLAFLGEVPDEQVPDARQAVAACAAATPEPLTLRIAGTGSFTAGRAAGGPGGTTVVWAGLHGDTAQLGALAERLRTGLRAAHLPFDPRPYRPHLTLARVPDRFPAADLAADLSQLQPYRSPPWRVDALHLVRSTLAPHRSPHYERLVRAAFGTPTPDAR